jgi:hypothetical protein
MIDKRTAVQVPLGAGKERNAWEAMSNKFAN